MAKRILVVILTYNLALGITWVFDWYFNGLHPAFAFGLGFIVAVLWGILDAKITG